MRTPGIARALAASLLVSGAAFGGTTLYVDDDAPAGGDGAGWDTAYTFLRDAIAAAESLGVSEIRIGGGVYAPDRSEAFPGGTGARDATFQLVANVAHRGGFAGFGAPDPDVRDVALYETILTGDLAGDDGVGFTGIGENSFHVVTSRDDVTLDGVTVMGGSARGTMGHGAGVNALSGHLTLIGSTVRRNSILIGVFRRGAGVFVGATAEIRRCLFDENRAVHGGALFAEGTVEIDECVFTRNRGGAFRTIADNCVVRRSLFTDNHTDTFGGGVGSEQAIEMSNCVFIGNSSRSVGGGAYSRFGLIVRNCTFRLNRADIFGGAVCEAEGSILSRVHNSVLWGNRAGFGFDEIFVLTGSINVRYCNVEGGWVGEGNILTDPTFADTTGTWTADATYDAAQDTTTFIDATASFDDVLFARVLVPNTEFDSFNASIVANDGTTIRIRGDLTGIGFEGASYAVAHHRVNAGSPIIDAAANFLAPAGATVDIDDRPRFVDDPDTPDTGSGEPPLIDMGAAEFQPCGADLDGSGAIDYGDVLAVMAAWGNAGGPEDLDGSGEVDFWDLLIVLTTWGACG